MEIFYSSNKIWLIKQQGVLCAHMPGFCMQAQLQIGF